MTRTILRIEHAVGSFDGWKKMFDSDPIGRQKSGVLRYSVSRSTDDPNYVLIDLEFDDSREAENFRVALRKLWGSAEAQKVMKDPQLRIVEVVDTKEY